MTDDAGVVVDGSVTKYYPFGSYRERPTTNPTTMTLGFTGHRHDDGAGLIYANARYYLPQIGRFASADSIVPDAGASQTLNRYAYVLNSPVQLSDPSGHCPTPPEDWGPTICMALFIQPASIQAGPFLVHGDGRGFSSNSAPRASRGYLWINLDTLEARSSMVSSGYITSNLPVYAENSISWFDPLDINEWSIVYNPEEHTVTVHYNLVLSGPLSWAGLAPHIDGEISFWLGQEDEVLGYELERDGFPWAEAYYHAGDGTVETIFQDPAVFDTPFDLHALHEGPANPLRFGVRLGQQVYYTRPPVISHHWAWLDRPVNGITIQ